MTRYKTGTYLCINCNTKFDILVTAEEYDNNTKQTCSNPDCECSCDRIVGSPMVMEAAYPDGKKRFCKYKEESKERLHRLQEAGKPKTKRTNK